MFQRSNILTGAPPRTGMRRIDLIVSVAVTPGFSVVLAWSSTIASWVVELKAVPAELLHPSSAANQGSASQLPPTTPPTPRLAPDRAQLAPKSRGRHLAVKQTPTRFSPKAQLALRLPRGCQWLAARKIFASCRQMMHDGSAEACARRGHKKSLPLVVRAT